MFLCHLRGKCVQEFAAALKLSREKGVGAATFRRLMENHSLPTLAYQAWLEERVGQEITAAVSQRKSSTNEQVELALSQLASGKISGRYYSQKGYPEALKDLGEPPPVLFFSGELPEARFAAVVGARKCVPFAEKMTVALVRCLIAEGFTIISGGAAGIDAVAHQAALGCGCKTVAVLATGVDIVYPACNQALFERIKENGALVSEMMPGAKPVRSFFPTRNRLIAAMADVVAVVQADAGSGSLITAGWAAKLGRKILTVEPPAGQPEIWAGNQKLIAAGAGIFTGESKSAYSVAELAANFGDGH